MTTVKIIFYIFFIVLLSSCGQRHRDDIGKKFIKDKQVPIIDSSELDIRLIAPDTVLGDDEFYAKIALAPRDEKLLEVYADCDVSNSLIDTTKKCIDNCKMRLEVKADTAQFHIWPKDSTYSFSIPLAILTIDNNKVYKVRTYNIKINSKKKNYR